MKTFRFSMLISSTQGRGNAVIREDHTWTEVTYDVAKEYMLDKRKRVYVPVFLKQKCGGQSVFYLTECSPLFFRTSHWEVARPAMDFPLGSRSTEIHIRGWEWRNNRPFSVPSSYNLLSFFLPADPPLHAP